MERLHLSSHVKIARGVEPRLGPFAARINVIMTEESIITVGSQLFRFCGLIARAFTRTLQMNQYFWDSKEWNSTEALRRLGGAPEILRYWMRIYLSYAVTGTHVMVRFGPRTGTNCYCLKMARAMVERLP